MATTLILFLITFAAVLLLERTVHRLLQVIALTVTGDARPATLLYAVPLLPGVALHEVSHALAAKLLGVPVRKLSLIPQQQKGSIRLGFVEVAHSGPITSSLIGLAPLIVGIGVLILIGLHIFNAPALVAALDGGDFSAVTQVLADLFRAPDAVLWFYLVFVIANSMMPSPSDTQSLPPVLFFVGLMGVAALFVFGTSWLLALQPAAAFALRWLSAAFALTTFVNIVVITVLWLLSRVLFALTGRTVTAR